MMEREHPVPAAAPDFHIITGGPGSGKSTLIDALAAQGFHHMPEAGRAIIRDQVAIGGTALPWADRIAFAPVGERAGFVRAAIEQEKC